MEVKRHREFDRQFRKLDRSIREKFEARMQLLFEDETHPLLHKHFLHPPYQGFVSINITGDIRLVYKKLDAGTIFLRAIGTHHQLYGK
jgi:mRNA-degrading endonuclease YafQ of YafQ-DinJ toxin-antitoxin module